MSAQKSYLPKPEFESCMQHSFKPPNNKRSKKPPRLHPNTSFSKLASPSFQVISFGNDSTSSEWKNASQANNESYFERCFDCFRKIGEGSFSEVYQVRSKEDGNWYAIKKSNMPYRSEFYRERSLDEVRYLETFSKCSNCVTFYKAWEQNGYLFMQLELCETLESRIHKLGTVEEDFYWDVLLDILLAVKALHDRDLIHLDIKLDNILIDDDNVCKLGDFGLVVDTKTAKKNDSEGDCRYIAPEVLEGHFSKAADIFSLGITMLELVSNLDLQTNGPLWQELREGIIPSVCLDVMSVDFKTIIPWMMAPSPSKRPDVDTLLSSTRIKKILEKRQKSASVKLLITCYRKTSRFILRNIYRFWNFIRHYFESFPVYPVPGITQNTPKQRDDSTYSALSDFSDADSPPKNLSMFATSPCENSMILNPNIVNSTPVIRHGYRSRSNIFSHSMNSSVSSMNDSMSLTRKKLFAYSEDNSD